MESLRVSVYRINYFASFYCTSVLCVLSHNLDFLKTHLNEFNMKYNLLFTLIGKKRGRMHFKRDFYSKHTKIMILIVFICVLYNYPKYLFTIQPSLWDTTSCSNILKIFLSSFLLALSKLRVIFYGSDHYILFSFHLIAKVYVNPHTSSTCMII